MLTPTPKFLLALIDAALAVAAVGPTTGPLGGLKVTLSTSAIPQGVDVSVGVDVVEPAFVGYAAQACPFGLPVTLDNGDIGCIGPVLTFQEAGVLTAEVIMGYALVANYATTKDVLAVENFATPKTLATLLDALQFVPVIDLPLASIGSAVVLN